METVIGIFDENYVDDAIQALYDDGFDKSQVKVVDRTRAVDGPTVGIAGLAGEGTLGSNAPVPMVAYDVNAFGSDLKSVGRGDAKEFYSTAIQNGATVILVKVKDEEADEVRQIMRKAHASNVTEPTAQV